MTRFALLHAREVLRHPGRSALVVVALAAATTLLVTVLTLASSMTGAVGELTRTFDQVDLVVRGVGDRDMADDVTDTVRATPGVSAAAPLVQAEVTVDGELTYLIGAGPEALDLLDVDAACLHLGDTETSGAVIAGPALGSASSVTITPASGPTRTVPVAGTASCQAAERFNAGRFVAADLASSQDLAGRSGGADTVLVDVGGTVDGEPASVETVRERLADAVAGQATVDTPGTLRSQAERAVMPFQQGLLIVTMLSLLVAGFLSFNIVTVSVLERRQQLATLWAVGSRPRPLIAGLVAEAAILGLIGAATGAAAGLFLAARLVERIPAFLVDTIGVRPVFTPQPLQVAAAVAVGTLAAVVAAAVPVWQIVRHPSAAALRPGGQVDSPSTTSFPRRAAGVGGVLAVAGLVAAVALPGAIMPGLALAIVGIVAVTFGAADHLARLSATVVSGLGRPGRLAAIAIGRAPRRVWSTIMAVAVAVAVVVTTGNLADTQVATFDRMWRSLGDVDVWAQSVPSGRAPLGPRFDDAAVDRVANLEGVESVSGGWSMRVDIDGRNITLDALLPGSRSPGRELASETARRRLDDGTGAVVTSTVADRLGLSVGDSLLLPTPQGATPIEVIDVIDLLTSTEGLIAVPHGFVADPYSEPGVSWVEVGLTPDASHRAVETTVEDALRQDDGPTPHAFGGQEHYRGALSGVERSADMFTAMQWAIIVAAALAVANTLVVAVNDRRRELGVIRAIGGPRSAIRRMVFCEAFAYGVIGLALGVVLGLLQFRAALVVVETLTGTGLDNRITASPVALATAAVAVVVIGAGFVAGRTAARDDVEAALRWE